MARRGGRRGARGPVTSEATRHVMQANKSKDTSPELVVRAGLRERGLTGYRLHWKKAPGRPDVCFPGRKVAIFVNGCFWHRCPHCHLSAPKTNVDFWTAKFARNRARDLRDCNLLVQSGWVVLVVWECRLKKGRAQATLDEMALLVRRAGDPATHVPQVREVGAMSAWQLGVARGRLARR